MLNKISLPVLAFIVASAGVAGAQNDLTPEEIAKRLENQATRGLVIAPKPGATPEATPTAAPATGIVELERDDQVNIRVTFDYDSAALRDDQKVKVDALCTAIKSIDIDVFRIVGHTDASGSATYNDQLSKLRAEEVKRYMVSDCGIAANRLEAIGAGERALFDKENPNSGDNRRVELQALS